MNKKILTLIMALTLLFGAKCFGQGREYYSITFVDEWGDPRTDITQVDVETTAGVDVAVYSTQLGSTEVGSTGVITTGLSDGMVEFWYEDTSIDLGVTDGTHTLEIETFTNTTYRFWFPNHLNAFTGSDYGVNDDIDFSYASWIIDGDTTNRLDMIPDNDGGILGIGDGTNQADVYIYKSSTAYIFFDEGNGILEMVGIDIDLDDNSVLTIGSGNDWTIYDDTGDQLEIDPGTAGAAIYLGTSDTDAVDVKWFTDVSGNYVLFDEENDEVYFTDVDIQLDDDTDLVFGTNDDFAMYSDTANILEFDPATAGNEIRFGTSDTDAVDITWYSDVSGNTVTFDEENDEVLFTDVDLQFDDDANLIIGSDDEWTIDNSSEVLRIIGSDADDDFSVTIGVTTEGVDFKVWGATGTEYFLWDASGDYLHVVGDKTLLTMTGTTVPIRLDATGTVASGNAIEFETTSGPIQILADGDGTGDITIDANDTITIVSTDLAANGIYLHANGGTSEGIKIHSDQGTGDESVLVSSDVGGVTIEAKAGSIDIEATGGTDGDIGINAGDDMTLTAAGDLTLAVTGTLAGGGATMDNFYSTTEVVAGTTDTLTAAQSGNMIIYTMTGGACTVTLPEATSGTVGMWFILIDGNATAGNDLTIDPEGAGQINGDTAGEYIKCENDRDGEGILIFSTAADTWYTMACGSSTVWTEE